MMMKDKVETVHYQGETFDVSLGPSFGFTNPYLQFADIVSLKFHLC